MTITIKDWSRFQHFKDRRPPWIKLYRDLLDDIQWHKLDGDSAKALTMLWLIASESGDGSLPPTEELAFRLRTSVKSLESTISKLSHWLVQDDINMISERYQNDLSEREREKRQRESPLAKARATVGLNLEAFESWMTYRKELGKPIKSASFEACAIELAKLGARQLEAVNHSKANGYQGLFTPKTNGHPQPEPQRSREFTS